MATKRPSKPATKAPAKPAAKKQEKAKPKKPSSPAKPEVVGHEHDDSCGGVTAAEQLFGKNDERAYALRDLWFESLEHSVNEQVAPERNKREMLFLTLTNSILDMMMDILPEELAVALAENLDDYLAITLINQKYNVDLLNSFQEEFLAEKGDNFETQEDLAEALADFEEKFWDSPRKELDDKSPNQVVEAALKHYDLL